MIYLNFLWSKAQKSKWIERIKTVFVAAIIMIIGIYILVNIFLALPAIVEWFSSGIQSLLTVPGTSVVAGNVSSGTNVMLVVLMLGMPVALWVFIRVLGFGGYRGSYGLM